MHQPPVWPGSLYEDLWWLERRTCAGIAAAFFLVVNLVLFVVAATDNLFNVSMYTWWNFVFITVWLAQVVAGLWFEGKLNTLIAMGITPIVMSSVTLVPIIIVLVIAINDEIYIKGSVYQPIPGEDPYTFKEIHTGDWVMHGVPFLEFIVIMYIYYQSYMRMLFYHFTRSRSRDEVLLYFFFFIFAAALPLVIYSIPADPLKRYPTGLSLTASIAIVGGLMILTQSVWLVGLLAQSRKRVPAPQFYNRWLRDRIALMKG